MDSREKLSIRAYYPRRFKNFAAKILYIKTFVSRFKVSCRDRIYPTVFPRFGGFALGFDLSWEFWMDGMESILLSCLWETLLLKYSSGGNIEPM